MDKKGAIDPELKKRLDLMTRCFEYWLSVGNIEQAVETARMKERMMERG